MRTKGKILVIDDDADMRELFVTLLQIKGYDAYSSPVVPVNLSENRPDVMLLDFMLSGKSGLQICEQLKSDPRFSDIPVIMVSGMADMKEKCLLAGAEDFILKPFDIAALLNSIHKALEQQTVTRF